MGRGKNGLTDTYAPGDTRNMRHLESGARSARELRAKPEPTSKGKGRGQSPSDEALTEGKAQVKAQVKAPKRGLPGRQCHPDFLVLRAKPKQRLKDEVEARVAKLLITEGEGEARVRAPLRGLLGRQCHQGEN